MKQRLPRALSSAAVSPFWRHRQTILLAALALAACEGKKEQSKREVQPRKMVTGGFLVGTENREAKTQLQQDTQTLAETFSCSKATSEKIPWGGDDLALPEDLDNMFYVKFDGCDLSPEKNLAMLHEINSFSYVKAAEADAIAEATIAPGNDPGIPRQYYLDSIKRNTACDVVAQNKKPVIVAVVDSGVERNHPDLENAFYRDAQGKIIGANFVDQGMSAQPTDEWDDQNGHGTHVAGTIAATANNGKGIVGVASCSPVRIMPIRVLGADGSGSSLAINRGIKWAVDHGADVINLSLGYMALSRMAAMPHYKDATINYAIGKGTAIFAAAGNDGHDNGTYTKIEDAFGRVVGEGYGWSFPASYDGVISVAATNSRNRLTSFSNYGKRIHIAAPGESIYATYPGKSYQYLSGTSMATPIAVGVYAMAKSFLRETDHNLTNEEIISLFESSVVSRGELASSQTISQGILDAAGLLQTLDARFKKPTEPVNPEPNKPDEPVTPDHPVIEQPMPSFVGLTDGQRSFVFPVKLGHLAREAYAVSFYWGPTQQRIATIAAQQEAGSDYLSANAGRWILRGSSQLRAVIFDKNGKKLGETTIQLQGIF